MGLDMFAYRVRIDTDRPMPDVDARFTAEDARQTADGVPLFAMVDADLHYWRKHPDLHGWMEQLYRRKGGVDPDFNCNSVRLGTDDLDALEDAIARRSLPHTTGFFFGESRPEDIEDDRDFIAKARAAIREGDAVYYSSWW